MTFHDPWWLIAGAVSAALLWLWPRPARPSLRMPSLEPLRELAAKSRSIWLQVPPLLRTAALICLAVALARPQRGLEASRIHREGIDIVLVLDVSGSMLAEDFELNGQRRNRVDVVKDVVKTFVDHRPNDRMALVAFAGRAYTVCPLTLDHSWLLQQLERVSVSTAEDGTAIGSGIATGLNRLRNSKAKSRVMILLTDGVNNAGNIAPDTAAQMAKSLSVKIYAIGAGSKGEVPYPMTDMFGRKVYRSVRLDVDDEGLARIAETTGGRYFRATDTASLRTIYAQIDRMETTNFEQPHYLVYRELYAWWAAGAMLLVLLELTLRGTRSRVLP